jgi:two-component system response regulator HydG
MNSPAIHPAILVVDDDLDTASLLRDALRERGFAAEHALSAEDCLTWVQTHRVDLVVTDFQMPGMNGVELIQHLHEADPDVLAIVITGVGGLDAAIAAIRAGAYDFITKPVKLEALSIAISRAVDHLGLMRELNRLRSSRLETTTEGIVGSSQAMHETLELVRRVADSDATVLITGESGSGKEVIARAIHNLSPRRDQPFVAINCAAMPAPLLESELFGHVRGAFTDAKFTRTGLFVQAQGGTLLLDEIGEMPMEMQVKLLRVLQERTVRPVGGDHELPVHARIIAATNKDLEAAVEEKRFREDLFYRINVVAIPVPPLRARQGDILVMAQYFLRRIAERAHKAVEGISEAAARLLVEYDWPGNVRELENCMERAVALSRLDQITVDDLPSKLQEHRESKMVIATSSPTELVTLDEMERRYARYVLAACGGNKTQAARILGMNRRSLYRRLQDPEPAGAGAADEEAEPDLAATPSS